MGILDDALDSRFTGNTEMTVELSNDDTLLIHDDSSGNIFRIKVSTLATFFSSAISQSDILTALSAPNGVATLDTGGKVYASQLPSYVDDVLEYSDTAAFPGTGESGKIYLALDTGKIYRWGGSAYAEISASPGSTDAVPEGATNLYHTTARASAAAPVQSVAGKTGTVSLVKGDVGLGNVDNTSDADKPISTVTQTALNGKASTSLPSWTDVASGDFLNSWVNYGASYANAGYYKDDTGVVHLKGLVKSGTVQSNIFILPAGYRPPHTIYIAVLGAQGVGGLLIYATGAVMYYFGSNTYVSLENIHFRAA